MASRELIVKLDFDEVLRRIPALRAAIEIVELLACSDPIKVGQRPDVGSREPRRLAPMIRYEKCLICEVTDGHGPGCAWKRAEAWVRTNPRQREATDGV